MKIAHRVAVRTIALCVGVAADVTGLAAAAGAPNGVARPGLEDRAANSAGNTATIIRILDRWYPVASELRQDVAVWRAQFRAVLERTSLSTLQAIDAMEATSGGPNRTLVQLYQTAYSMAVSDVGARLAKQIQSAKAAKLGSTTTDLVFVALTPCRVVDTRNTGLGISFGTQRNFYYYSDGTPASWLSQGGDPGAAPTACPNTVLTSAGGTLGNVAPAAAMANIAAVNTTAPGNFIAWGGSVSTIPNTSVLNWDHAGEIIANTTIIPWGGRTGGNLDFTIRYNGPSGFSDVVVDVMGYFIENAATALDCTTTSTPGTIAVGTGSDTTIAYPACPTGYSRTGGYCNGGSGSGTSGIYLVESGAAACVFRNLGGASAPGSAISQCCRVPGR